MEPLATSDDDDESECGGLVTRGLRLIEPAIVTDRILFRASGGDGQFQVGEIQVLGAVREGTVSVFVACGLCVVGTF